MFENPRRGRQARNFTTNVPKILVLKSDNTLLDLLNSSYPTQPHSLIAKKLISKNVTRKERKKAATTKTNKLHDTKNYNYRNYTLFT